MKGYLKNDDETKRTLREGGWLHTGDLAYYDSDKFFYVVGRLKELIKVNALQVAPAELEDILKQHPKIADAAIIGIPNDKKGQVPFAFVVKKQGLEDDLEKSEMHDFLRDKVADYKYLAGGIMFRETIPYSPAGKLLRKDLLEIYNNEIGQNK